MPKQPEDPADVGEPGAHPPKQDLPDNDPADPPEDHTRRGPEMPRKPQAR